MARLHYNGLLNSLGGAGLTNVATAVTFTAALTHSGGTAVPTIGGGDIIPLSILGADNKLAEIVHLTAYVSGATTGTILRGQEGTAGVAHGVGAFVVHAPTAEDWNPVNVVSTFDAKGDLLAGTGNDALARLAVGSNGQLLLPDSAQSTGLKWSTTRLIEGTGSPEGVVTAVIGCTYVDTAATNGAVRWVKHTGTGNTGWKVEFGDSGWRRVVSAGDLATLPGLRAAVRRINSNVYVAIAESPAGGTATGAVTLTNVPVGFRWTDAAGGVFAFTVGPVGNQSGVPLAASSMIVLSTGDIRLAATNGARHYGMLTYLCTDTWPVTLPGIAA